MLPSTLATTSNAGFSSTHESGFIPSSVSVGFFRNLKNIRGSCWCFRTYTFHIGNFTFRRIFTCRFKPPGVSVFYLQIKKKLVFKESVCTLSAPAGVATAAALPEFATATAPAALTNPEPWNLCLCFRHLFLYSKFSYNFIRF